MKYSIYMLGNPYWGKCGCGGAIYLGEVASKCKCEKCGEHLKQSK